MLVKNVLNYDDITVKWQYDEVERIFGGGKNLKKNLLDEFISITILYDI